MRMNIAVNLRNVAVALVIKLKSEEMQLRHCNHTVIYTFINLNLTVFATMEYEGQT